MMTIIFLKGLAIGFMISIPVGPIAILCIRRTLNEGSIHGIVTGLGAATADVIYGFIALSGLTFISNFLIKEHVWLHLLGGLFLCHIGVKVFRSKLEQRANSGSGASYLSNYISAFLLTLTNPSTFLVLAAVFAGLGVIKVGVTYTSAGLLVGGVFVGSGLWWFMLSSVAGLFFGKLDYTKLAWLNKISGIIIAGFGLFAIISLVI
jgi:threonine/homoserine/homoserine lactone efflux protein